MCGHCEEIIDILKIYDKNFEPSSIISETYSETNGFILYRTKAKYSDGEKLTTWSLAVKLYYDNEIDGWEYEEVLIEYCPWCGRKLD